MYFEEDEDEAPFQQKAIENLYLPEKISIR